MRWALRRPVSDDEPSPVAGPLPLAASMSDLAARAPASDGAARPSGGMSGRPRSPPRPEMLRSHESSYVLAALGPSRLPRPTRLTAPFRRDARDSRRPSGGGVEEAIVTKGAMPEPKARH
jgi:hypothetical protein